MTTEELKAILNKIHFMYRNSFVEIENPKRAALYVKIYEKQLCDLEYVDVDNAVDYYIQNNDTNFAPTIKRIREIASMEKNKRLNNVSSRRIETSEEVCANLYHEIMAKTKKTDDDWQTLERLKKYVMLFEGEGWQERYIAHFGKPREEFEKL